MITAGADVGSKTAKVIILKDGEITGKGIATAGLEVQGAWDEAWGAALKEAGITNFHFHDLRHTFASNMLLSGASLKDVKEMMGHSDISMTDRYAHLTHSHMLQRQSKLAEHYQNENT